MAATCCAPADSARSWTTDRTGMYSLCAPHPPTRRPHARPSRRPGQRVPVDPVPLCKARHAGKPAPGSRCPPRMGARRSAAICGTARRPAARPPPPSCPMRPDVLAYHRRDNVPGQIRARIRPPGPSAKITQGARPLQQEPTMQPNTLNTHHDTDPPGPARAAGGTGPGPGRGAHPAPTTAPATGNGPGRGLPDRRAARPAARRLPGDGPAAGDRRGAAAHRGVPRRPQDNPPLPAAVRRGVRGQRPGRQPTWPPSPPPGGRGSPRPHGDGPTRRGTATWPLQRVLLRAGGSWLRAAAPTLTCSFPSRGESAGPARQVCAACPVRAAVPGLRHHQPDRARHLGRADRAGTPRAAVPLGARLAAGA